jgi:hypothetical protein
MLPSRSREAFNDRAAELSAPENGRLVIEVHGNLAGIPAIAHRKAPPARSDGAVSRAKLNAGNHDPHGLRKHIGRP